MECSEILFSRHALRRMFQRSVGISEVTRIVHEGEVIEEYPDDEPWPEAVLLGEVGNLALHVVVGREPVTLRCVTITVYWPDLDRWDERFRHRRR